MNEFVTTFGFYYGVIGKEENGQFIKRGYNDLIEYGGRSKRFKSNISFNGNDVIVGEYAKKDEIYIENVGLTFRNDIGKEDSLNGKVLSINDIVKAYFSKVKEQLDSKKENDPCDLMHIVIPNEFTSKKKQQLKTILKDINFPLGGLVEEPVASYFGYVKKNQLQYLEKDSFMMVNIDYDSIKVKIFDIKQTNQEFTFYLDSHESNNEFNIYSLLSKKILSLMEGDLKYNDLSSSDQIELKRALQELIDHFQNREENSPYDFYIGLSDADAELDKTITRDQFIEMLQENIDLLQETISKCIQKSQKSKGEIRKIIYTGDAREVYGLQETINQEFDIDQEIMIGEDDLACLGAFEAWKMHYQIVDTIKSIGFVGKRGDRFIFLPKIQAYSSTKKRSIKTKIPQRERFRISIYEGYKDVQIDDCVLLNVIDLIEYADGEHSLVLTREANNGHISLEIYNQDNKVDTFKVL